MKQPVSGRILIARVEADEARRRLAATLDVLQERLKPAALANQAWSGVREKGGEIADGAFQAVKDRPVAVSGLVAAFALYLAREPLASAASRLLSANGKAKSRGKPAKARRRAAAPAARSKEGASA